MRNPEPRARPGERPDAPRRRGWRLAAAWAAPVLYAAAIYVVSSRPDLPKLPPFPGFDKLLHAAEYAGFAALLALAFGASGLRAARAALAAVALAGAFGFTDEVHQFFVPNRDSDPLDLVADVIGASVGAGLAAVRLRGRRAQASIRR